LDQNIVNKLIEIVEQAKKVASKISDPSKQEEVLREVIESHFCIHIRIKNFEEARKIVNEIKGSYERFLAFLYIAKETKDVKDIEKAIKAANEIENLYYKVGAFLNIFKFTNDINYIEKAREIASKIEDPYYQAEAFLGISRHTKDIKDIEKAWEITKIIAKNPHYIGTGVLEGEIIDRCIDIKNFEKAREIANEIKGTDSLALYDKAKILAHIADITKDNKDIEKAREIASKIKKDFIWRAYAFKEIARVTKDNKDIEKAWKAANRIRDASSKHETLESIIHICIESKNFEEARKIVNEIKCTEPIDFYNKAGFLANIAEKTKDINDIERALEVANKIEDLYYRFDIFAYIVYITKDINYIERALEVANKIEDPYKQAEAFAKILRILVGDIYRCMYLNIISYN